MAKEKEMGLKKAFTMMPENTKAVAVGKVSMPVTPKMKKIGKAFKKLKGK